jgi:NCS1 nucleoside transporter family
MSTATETKPSTGFEVTGIERVPENERAHTQLADTMWLWWSANSVVATVALGALSFFFGLGFWGSVAVIVVFNILGVLPVAFLSTLGPKTGLAQMPLTRFSFGLQGAKLPALFNAVACVLWSAVNITIGSSLLVTFTGGALPQWAAFLILATVTTLVSVFGYFIVHRYERFAWIPMFILFGYIFVAGVSKFHTDIPVSVSGIALFASIATLGGAVFGYAVGWSSYAADYTRRQPAETPAGRVFLYAFLGVVVPCIILEVLGVLLTTTLAANATLPDAGTLIGGVIGTGPVASVVILLLAFSTIANNVPNDYSFALSLQVLGVRVIRWVLTIIGAVLYVLVALVIQQNFNLNLEGFLLLIAYWLGAWNAIVIIEHLLRRGNYPVNDYEDGSKLPPGWAAVIAMVVGLAAAALGINQAATIGFQGPLSVALGGKDFGADIGFPIALVVTAVVYFILRRIEMASSKR